MVRNHLFDSGVGLPGFIYNLEVYINLAGDLSEKERKIEKSIK